jgi:hypothetical protein
MEEHLGLLASVGSVGCICAHSGVQEDEPEVLCIEPALDALESAEVVSCSS